jgi:signal transduction histidine kinase/CheY-like chemotaxis protein
LQLNLLVLSYVASAAVSGLVALAAWRRRNTVGARELTLLMVAAGWWLLASAFEASSVELPGKIAWSVVAYPGIEAAPVAYLLFVLAWTRHDRWLTRARIALLLVVPLASVGMAATNQWHHLLWPTVSLIDAWGVTAVYEHGPWFWVEVAYAYCLVGAGLVALVAAIYRYPVVYAARIRLVIVASAVPIVASAIYAAGLGAFVHADLSSLAFAIAGVLGAWAVLRSRLLDIIPVAWSTLVDSLADAVLVLDPEGRIAAVNLSATRLLGTGADAVGRSFDLALCDFPELVDACRGSGDHESEIPIRPGQSEPSVTGQPAARPRAARWFNVRVSPIGDGPGSDAGRIVVLRDVTEHRAFEDERRSAEAREVELEARLRQSAKMEAVGQLAGGVAHDFNNLLTVIRGFAELHLAEHPHGDPGRDDVIEIERAAERAAQLTRGLLAFGRRTEVRPAPIDLAEVARDAVVFLRRLVGEHIVVRLDATADTPCVLADRGQIDQVLLNLAANARDAMPAGGNLVIAVRTADLTDTFVQGHPGAHTGVHVLLEVSDTGIGMDEATQAHLFEPFFTTKSPGQGTGLGLASVYGIVKQAEGYIDVESHPGSGSVFRVYLPALDTATPEAKAGPATCQAHRPGTETILLVEDESAVRLFAQRVLQNHGYRVLAFGDPRLALDSATGDPSMFDALVTDVVMPTMSGPALAELITDLRPGLPILFMSGYGGNALPAGAPTPLCKPFSAPELTDAVGGLFGRGD